MALVGVVPCSNPLQYHYWHITIIDAQEGPVFTVCVHMQTSRQALLRFHTAELQTALEIDPFH